MSAFALHPGERLAAIALGSNLGDRARRLDEAVRALGDTPGLRVLAVSQAIETEPVGGPPGQPLYLNAVLVAASRLAARPLLARLQELERRAGRDRAREGRNGARPLDLDLLVLGDERSDAPELALPHPRLEERRFVLEPLAEIAPELVLPRSGLTAREALARLGRRAS